MIKGRFGTLAVRILLLGGAAVYRFDKRMIRNAASAAEDPARENSLSLRGPREFVFLCALAVANPSAERRQFIASWNFASLDWDNFLGLAEKHGVLALAARNLIELDHTEPHAVPPETLKSLRSAYQANLRRCLWFASELTRIVQHFARNQVRAIPYKGPLLAQSVYGDPALRSFSDLDFLISPAGFERAKQSLAEIGYRPTAELTPAVERFWLRRGYERSFDGAAGENLVELQWALLPYFYAVDLRVEDLLARAGRAAVGEGEVPCLSAEDSLLVLCLHAAKHLWTRLIWLADIAETLRSQNIDHALVSERARALGVVRILAVSFWLAKHVLGAELSNPAEEMIASDPATSAIGSEFAERLSRGATYDFESTEYFQLIMKLRERRADRWKYLWRLAGTPGASDLAAVELPEKLFSLYRVVRMARLARRFLRAPTTGH
jgi:hypothetical protein